VPDSAIPAPESAPKRPVSFYGLSKYAGAEYVRLYQEQYGIEGVSLALGNVYGPRQDPAGEAGVVAIFAARLLSGRDCVVNGDGHSTRDYVFVSEVADAIVRSLRRGSGLINIGSGVETSVLDVYRAVATAVGTDREPVFGPPLPGEARRVCLDRRKAKGELGWTPRVALGQGVRSVVDWLRQERRPQCRPGSRL